LTGEPALRGNLGSTLAASLYALVNFCVNAFASGAVGRQTPRILRVVASQNVPVTALRQHSKIGRARRIPTVLHFRNLDALRLKHNAHWPLFRLIAGVTFHANELFRHVFGSMAQALARFRRLSADSAFHAAPRNTITPESCIHT